MESPKGAGPRSDELSEQYRPLAGLGYFLPMQVQSDIAGNADLSTARLSLPPAVRDILDAADFYSGLSQGNTYTGATQDEATANFARANAPHMFELPAAGMVASRMTGLDAGGLLGMFAGPKAKTANRAALKMAQRMADEGIDERRIWDETGWFKGADGKWRFEIDDSGAAFVRQGEINGTPVEFNRLGDALKYPELHAAYDDLGSIKVSHTARPGAGSYIEERRLMNVGPAGDSTSRRVALHETQHAVQNREGFARGGDPKMYGAKRADIESAARAAYEESAGDNALLRELGLSDAPDVPLVAWDELTQRQQLEWYDAGRSRLYRRLAGEVEARNVEARMDMTPDQRRATPPWETEDVAREHQIVRYANPAPAAAPAAVVNAPRRGGSPATGVQYDWLGNQYLPGT